MYHASPQETETVVKRIFSSLSNPSGGYKIKCPDEIIAITKLGSRLWGTFHYQSDYDCLVIHSNPSKSVKHIGATIAAKEIDVRLESIESMVEQMKAGSVRCWLSFLLLIADSQAEAGQEQQQNNKKNTGNTKALAKNDEDDENKNDDDEGDDETNDNDGDEAEYHRHTSILFSIRKINEDKLTSFIRHIITSVGAVDKDAVVSKLAETLAEDEQRVLKTVVAGNSDEIDIATIEKAQKIMKHSLRLVFSTSLIQKAMKLNEEHTGKKKTNSTNKNKTAASTGLNAFNPILSLEKDVFVIEDKIKSLLASDANFKSCLDSESPLMNAELISKCYQAMMSLFLSDWMV